MHSVVHTIQQLKGDIRHHLQTHGGEKELPKLEYALEDITQYHADQIRRSGEPVIIHPLRVAWSICEASLDAPTVIAALLHDIIEDTEITKEYIKERYGEWYANMVDGLTKITHPHDGKGKRQANQEATYHKMLTTMVKDVRILFIKLFDRLDNMRDMAHMPRSKQRRISRETYNVYVPLAKRMGLEQISQEFIELCFKYLYPKRYEQTKDKLSELKKARQSSIQSMCQRLHTTLSKSNLYNTDVNPIFVQLDAYITKQEVDQILKGFRVLVDDTMYAYQALGILHTQFKAVPLKIRDFISNPRWDGYSGLQTEIIVEGEVHFLEIVSKEMHGLNLHGVMARWKGTSNDLAEYYRTYLSQIENIVGEKEPRMDEVLRYSREEQIQVFTPKGQSFYFLKGTTILDFAYQIHTDLGNTCIGAEVNVSANDTIGAARRKRVPRSRQLIDGESVHILTDPSTKPRRDWFDYIINPKSRTEIQRSLRIQYSQRTQQLREEFLRNELRRLGHNAEQMIQSADFKEALELEKLPWEVFLERIGTRKITIKRFLEKYELLDKEKIENRNWRERFINPIFETNSPEILIGDNDDAFILLAECCSPIPGDRVVGFITPQQELEIHRANCNEIKGFKDQIVSVGWKFPKDDLPKRYDLQLLTLDTPGALFQITRVIKNLEIGIVNTHIEHIEKDALIHLTLDAMPLKTYHKILSQLRTLKVIKKII